MSNCQEPYCDPYAGYKFASCMVIFFTYLMSVYFHIRLVVLAKKLLKITNFNGENDEDDRWAKDPSLQPLYSADPRPGARGLVMSTRSFRNYRGA